jgi:SAM-dependent methyltransferase
LTYGITPLILAVPAMAYSKTFVNYYDVFKDETDYRKSIAKLSKILEQYKVKSILDIGSGTGRIDRALKNKGYRITGIDNSKEMIAYAKRKYPDIEFKQMDARSFNLGKKFDAIIALDSVLTFLVRKGAFEAAIRNISLHLRKGAILYFSTGFSDELIPQVFQGDFVKEIEKKGTTYRKEISMRRKGHQSISEIRILKNNDLIIQEKHVHRILSETPIRHLLTKSGFRTRITGNSHKPRYQPLEVIAEKQ